MTIVLPPECLPPVEPEPADVLAAVAEAWDVPVAQIRGPARDDRTCGARRAAIVALARLCPSLSASFVAMLVGRERTTVLHYRSSHARLA